MTATLMLSKKNVAVYTDGACSGNPGPGGWGAVLCYKGREKEISGGEALTTNNRMELTAVISALECLKEPCEVDLGDRVSVGIIGSATVTEITETEDAAGFRTIPTLGNWSVVK